MIAFTLTQKANSYIGLHPLGWFTDFSVQISRNKSPTSRTTEKQMESHNKYKPIHELEIIVSSALALKSE